MTEQSKEGIVHILSKLKTEELRALAATVTQGFLKNKVRGREEAIDSIIKYSSDEVSILRRKVITKDLLFEYLHDKEIPIRLPVTKNELINKIAQFWSLPTNSSFGTYSEFSSSQSEFSDASDNRVYIDSIDNYHIQVSDGHSSQNTYNEVSCAPTCSQFQQGSYASDRYEVGSVSEDDTMYNMAEQFTGWFYSLLNQNAPIDKEHLYPDASLKLNVFSDDVMCNCEIVENNPDEVAAVLFRYKMQNSLFFNPNISKEGIKGKRDSHGLVIILACGTLHVNNICAGVFEQVFALARDPFADNNWKIKNTQLNLKSKQGVMGPPSLCDNELTSDYLSLPSS